jgi:hypothetical protein
VPRHDPGLLVVPRRVAGELQNLQTQNEESAWVLRTG